MPGHHVLGRVVSRISGGSGRRASCRAYPELPAQGVKTFGWSRHGEYDALWPPDELPTGKGAAHGLGIEEGGEHALNLGGGRVHDLERSSRRRRSTTSASMRCQSARRSAISSPVSVHAMGTPSP